MHTPWSRALPGVLLAMVVIDMGCGRVPSPFQRFSYFENIVGWIVHPQIQQSSAGPKPEAKRMGLSSNSSHISMEISVTLQKNITGKFIPFIISDISRMTIYIYHEASDTGLKSRIIHQSLLDGFAGLRIKTVSIGWDDIISQEAKQGDIVLWMGNTNLRNDLMVKFRSNGVRTILHLTEIIDHPYYCQMHGWGKEFFDEIWDRDAGNIDLLKECGDELPPVRYVPVGCRGSSNTAPWSSSTNVESSSNSSELRLMRKHEGEDGDTGASRNPPIYIRAPDAECGRRWDSLKQLRLVEFEDVIVKEYWSDKEFEILLRDPVPKGIFLNLVKFCNASSPGRKRGGAGLERSIDPRLVLLASNANSKIIVVSEKAHTEDQSLYRDIIEFVDSEKLPQVLEEVMSLGYKERASLLEDRTHACEHHLHPTEILRRAEVLSFFAKLEHGYL
mmetsp:Transcript_37638/g.63260  ORF Transcript_37638/g.63260 Transcript_37638/m.63260 type:complete len:445 (+) Transcript_37638:92-1426(+)